MGTPGLKGPDGKIMKPQIQRQSSRDWCHLCGERSDQNAEVWYANNAEHENTTDRYIRICATCGKRIAAIATGPRQEILGLAVERIHPISPAGLRRIPPAEIGECHYCGESIRLRPVPAEYTRRVRSGKLLVEFVCHRCWPFGPDSPWALPPLSEPRQELVLDLKTTGGHRVDEPPISSGG